MSLQINHLTGFGVIIPEPVPVLIDRTLGTNIGDMTGLGGLAAAFDGTSDAPYTGTSTTSYSNTATGYVGKTLATPKAIFQAIAYPSNNSGFNVSGGITSVNLYGKQGAAPSSGTDGTLLASNTAGDTTSPVTLISSNKTTIYDHVWVYLVAPGTGDLVFVEIENFEAA